MEDIYLWGTAIVIGLLSLWLIPAKKLAGANRRMRARFSGTALAIMYIVIGILFFIGAMGLCIVFNAAPIVRNVILGAVIGLFIGFIPIVDKRNAEETDDKKEEKNNKKS